MSEDTIVENTVETDVKTEEGTKPELNAIPRSRLNEVIEERNTLREEIKSYELKQEEVKKAKLVEQEKWQGVKCSTSKRSRIINTFQRKVR